MQNAVLVMISVALCVGVAEVVARMLVPPITLPGTSATDDGVKSILAFDDKLGSLYKPNSSTTVRSQYGEFDVPYRINEFGLRERPLRDLRQSRRILVLGNSLVEGWGVRASDGFVRVIEAALNASMPGAAIATVNAGISGFGAAQSYLLYRKLRDEIKPDAVIFFYVSTMVHFDCNYLADAELDSDGLAIGLSVDAIIKGGSSVKDGSETFASSPAARKLAEYSALARMVLMSLNAKHERDKIIPGDPRTDLLAGVRAEGGALAKLHEPSLRHVAAIARLARQQNTPFLLVHLPLPHQISASEWSKGRVAYGLENRTYAAADRTVVEDFCRRERINCVAAHDPLARAERDSDGQRLFYEYDFHPNKRGNRIIGEWAAPLVAAILKPR